MRAIDLYSGAGGWSLGLHLAGVDVVASYERFEPANETNRKNNGHPVFKVDIRDMSLSALPGEIDLVVGSPPCTQFSYSNRGGKGNIADGLRDIYRFLQIVDHLKPRKWVMENVPRVADVLRREMRSGGQLHDFAHLDLEVRVLNMEEWGLPQRRRRCFAGNIDFDLLESYKTNARLLTLGDVVRSFMKNRINDPIYGLEIDRKDLFDHNLEPFLDQEEVRVNRSAKVSHPVYNAMQFPDPLDRSVRTITATCTRVSRESVVIESPEVRGRFRRLTLRERASLQGFPVTYQFYGASHGQKAAMIGNAVPPVFSYYVGSACLGAPVDSIENLSDVIRGFASPSEAPPITRVESAGKRYPADRRFRFSIPGLNFKSGVRFELSNKSVHGLPDWNVKFYFGSSKDIQSLDLGPEALQVVLSTLPTPARATALVAVKAIKTTVGSADVKRMQDVWARVRPGGTRPFDLLDDLSLHALALTEALDMLTSAEATKVLGHLLWRQFGSLSSALPGLRKLERYSVPIVAGAIIGSAANEQFQKAMSYKMGLPKSEALQIANLPHQSGASA